jgi:hypothetical protein
MAPWPVAPFAPVSGPQLTRQIAHAEVTNIESGTRFPTSPNDHAGATGFRCHYNRRTLARNPTHVEDTSQTNRCQSPDAKEGFRKHAPRIPFRIHSLFVFFFDNSQNILTSHSLNSVLYPLFPGRRTLHRLIFFV